jgi:type II secretory pathway component PulF
MLLEGGVHLSQALDIVVEVIDNQILADALETAKENIIKEGNIAQYLQETKVFPPIALHLIRTGEQSGELDTMLLSIAHTYEKESEELIDRLTGLINPIMLIVMAVIVGFIVMAIGQPIMQQGQGLDI